MSKELEALERIENGKYFVDFELDAKIGEDYKEEIAIIREALKEYELMKQTKIIVADKKISDDDLEKLKNQRLFVGNLEQCEIKPLFDEETQKKLKALEIIKKKRVNVLIFIGSDNIEEYNKHPLTCWKLTQEEYDLLKEVLL